MEKNKIPILYLYIYRNLSEKFVNIVTHTSAKCAMGQIIRRAPQVVYQEILAELCDYGLLTKINKHEGYRIIRNSNYEKQFKRLREYVFPLNPTI